MFWQKNNIFRLQRLDLIIFNFIILTPTIFRLHQTTLNIDFFYFLFVQKSMNCLRRQTFIKNLEADDWKWMKWWAELTLCFFLFPRLGPELHEGLRWNWFWFGLMPRQYGFLRRAFKKASPFCKAKNKDDLWKRLWFERKGNKSEVSVCSEQIWVREGFNVFRLWKEGLTFP